MPDREWLQRRRSELATQIRHCLAEQDPPEVNFSIPKHWVIAPVLRQFVYDPTFRGRTIPVTYRDGSRPVEPFPIGCLAATGSPPETSDDQIVKLGMSSGRHPDLDYLVDLYLTRNKDLNEESSMAAEEELTFRSTVEQLSEPCLDGGGEIWAFHTGLEPMIVGFYRGVVKVLQSRHRRGLPRTLVVKPWLYFGSSATKDITPDAPGGKLDSYTPEEVWW